MGKSSINTSKFLNGGPKWEVNNVNGWINGKLCIEIRAILEFSARLKEKVGP